MRQKKKLNMINQEMRIKDSRLQLHFHGFLTIADNSFTIILKSLITGITNFQA